MALGYAWFDSYDSVGYVLTLHISPHTVCPYLPIPRLRVNFFGAAGLKPGEELKPGEKQTVTEKVLISSRRQILGDGVRVGGIHVLASSPVRASDGRN